MSERGTPEGIRDGSDARPTAVQPQSGHSVETSKNLGQQHAHCAGTPSADLASPISRLSSDGPTVGTTTDRYPMDPCPRFTTVKRTVGIHATNTTAAVTARRTKAACTSPTCAPVATTTLFTTSGSPAATCPEQPDVAWGGDNANQI